ncbi:hypothetical protein BC936DRAFT_149076 [Jimgerdemannia flammicorona]|uniref:Uncharacterized protein n=1 Tax=Jimgerdemannia flammicorona TaxID=994334 RepID=A0A433D1M9_9FUNG|nr:hypothetical protein BC936DRAFT_149076 [Jimgerdemannia flammicorona]
MLSTLNFRKPQSAVSTKLLLTAEQRAELANLPPDSFVLEAWTHHDQQHANDFLAQHTLDRRQVSDQETKWKIISGHSRNSTDKEHVSRLYQCACGCHMAARSDVVGKRRTRQRWSFTGCLAFAEVKVRRDNGEIIKVYGYLTHNDQCRAAQPQLLPFPKRKKGADIQAAIASSTQVLVDLEALGAVFASVHAGHKQSHGVPTEAWPEPEPGSESVQAASFRDAAGGVSGGGVGEREEAEERGVGGGEVIASTIKRSRVPNRYMNNIQILANICMETLEPPNPLIAINVVHRPALSLNPAHPIRKRPHSTPTISDP